LNVSDNAGSDTGTLDQWCLLPATGGGPTTYTVGGSVSGLTGAGLVLSLNAGAQTLPVAASGAFTFPIGLADSSPYAVTVGTQPAGQTCSVSNGSGTISGANVTNVTVTCAAVPTYTVGGNVSGLSGSGLVLSLNSGSQTLPVSANGSFTFPTGLTNGAAYAVIVGTQPSGGDNCTVSNGSGTIAGANVTNVSVTCANDTIFADGFDPAAATCSPEQLFGDPSLENGGAPWDGFDSVFGVPFCDSSCDSGGTIVAHTGEGFVWFGGTATAGTATLSQSVVFPSGQGRWLNYWLIDQMAGTPAATLNVTIDGTQVLDVPAGTASEDYVAKTFQIPAQYLDGSSHEVKFNYAKTGGTAINGAMLDDITLDCAAQPTSAPARHSDPVRAALRRAMH
jgi:hypothetical protein